MSTTAILHTTATHYASARTYAVVDSSLDSGLSIYRLNGKVDDLMKLLAA